MTESRRRRTVKAVASENEEGDVVEAVDEVIETDITDLETGATARVTEETRTTRVVDLPGEQSPELGSVRRVFSEQDIVGQGGGGRRQPSTLSTGLRRSTVAATPDLPLWLTIEYSTDWLSFNNYFDFMDFLLCGATLPPQTLTSPEDAELVKRVRHNLRQRRFLPFTDTDAYRLLKVATEAFVSAGCGIVPFTDEDAFTALLNDPRFVQPAEERDITVNQLQLSQRWFDLYLEQVNGTTSRVLPYLAVIRRKLSDVPLKSAIFRRNDEDQEERCYGILTEKLRAPCLLELIWSYWHEQALLVQTMNTISRRFQNIRGPADRDPLANMELDPLRPLNNLLWGYIQDEQHRLTVIRRAYEYDHHYGLTLEGKAVPPLRTADSRSKFLESFHSLLYLCTQFYRQDDDTTVVADAFPILIALRDLHLQLTEGQHNQWGDLPSTARVEMLMQQWLLARPEFREALPTRIMVDYPEPWMDRVDAMKRLQGWPGANVMHFRDLARFGEQILLTVRFGEWNDATRDQAKVWARYWRSQIQSYIHAYRIVTGVDLTADATRPQQRNLIAMQPSTLLMRANGSGPAAAALPPPAPTTSQFRTRRDARTS